MNNIKIIRKNKKYNKKYILKRSDGTFIFDYWLDNVYEYGDAIIIISLNDKYNIINTQEKLILNPWANNIFPLSIGLLVVELTNKWNFIDRSGNITSAVWYHDFIPYNNNNCAVRLNNKWNFLNKEGKLISDTWFSEICDLYMLSNAYIIKQKKHSNEYFTVTPNGDIKYMLNDKYTTAIDLRNSIPPY